MINLILLFPLAACLILFLFKKNRLGNRMINIYALLHIVVSAIFCTGRDLLLFWRPFPFFEINAGNIIFLLIISIVFLAAAVYNNGYMKDWEADQGKIRRYAYMTLLLVFSATGAVLSSNLAAAWVFITGTILAVTYLICFSETKRSFKAARKYVFICAAGIALAFAGIIFMVISSGNLNSLYYSDLCNNARLFNPFWLKLSFVFILFGFGTSMGLAPVHFPVPDAHEETPSPISALLSAVLLNSSFLVILNVFKIMVSSGAGVFAGTMLLAAGFLSLFVTAVFVYHINNYKRMLAYSSIGNMGLLAIGTALGGIAMIAVIIHIIGHSLIKGAFFLTAGNIFKLYLTKKIKSVAGLLKTDGKTGWLWILSFVGISAFPPSVLFISEFLMLKQMLISERYVLFAVFALLLVIIMYGLIKSVFSMGFSPISAERENEVKVNVKKLNWTMYAPQIVMLLLVFVLGLNIPVQISGFLASAAAVFD